MIDCDGTKLEVGDQVAVTTDVTIAHVVGPGSSSTGIEYEYQDRGQMIRKRAHFADVKLVQRRPRKTMPNPDKHGAEIRIGDRIQTQSDYFIVSDFDSVGDPVVWFEHLGPNLLHTRYAKECEVLLTPDQWQERTGVRVLDPDGWDRQAKDWNAEWGRRIPKPEWDRRMGESTCSFPKDFFAPGSRPVTGTAAYMAPELKEGRSYEATQDDGEGAREPQAAIEIFLERDGLIRVRALYGRHMDEVTEHGSCTTIALSDLVARCKMLEDRAKHPPLTREELVRLVELYHLGGASLRGELDREWCALGARFQAEQERKKS